MNLASLHILNYKNVASADIELSKGINCFVGDNGAGKTNVLDTIYYMSFCKSYFGLPDSQNIRHGEPFFVLQGRYETEGRDEDVYIGFKRGSKKQFKRNKKEYAKFADHIGLLPLVIVSPRDESLIAESAEARRKYADSVISQCDRQYLDGLMAYNRLLTQRNALLKQMQDQETADMTLLDVIDQQMSALGTSVSTKRREFVEWLRPVLNRFYAQISSEAETVGMHYVTGLDRYDLYAGLVEARPRDLILGYTSRGIHKDDIEFTMGEYPIRRVGSQGQRKSFVIAMKLAQYHYLTEAKGCRPILLLDDVFDKLDGQRGDNLIALTASDEFDQIFITDTDMSRLRAVLSRAEKGFKIFRVSKGEVKEEVGQNEKA